MTEIIIYTQNDCPLVHLSKITYQIKQLTILKKILAIQNSERK